MKLYQLVLLVTTSLFVRADIAINDFLDFDGFIDFSFMVPIGIELESVEGNTVTLNIQSEEGSIYSIRHYPELSLAAWSVEGTTAILNETESSPVQNNQYIFTATSSQTKIEITFTEGLPSSAFFLGYLYIPNE